MDQLANAHKCTLDKAHVQLFMQRSSPWASSSDNVGVDVLVPPPNSSPTFIFKAFWLMVAWPPSGPATVVILVVDYMSELTIHHYMSTLFV